VIVKGVDIKQCDFAVMYSWVTPELYQSATNFCMNNNMLSYTRFILECLRFIIINHAHDFEKLLINNVLTLDGMYNINMAHAMNLFKTPKNIIIINHYINIYQFIFALEPRYMRRKGLCYIDSLDMIHPHPWICAKLHRAIDDRLIITSVRMIMWLIEYTD
jgi:hypothetical protein